MADYRPGDVKITKLTLSSLDGKRTLDVSGLVVKIDIFESVIQPVILGEFVFADGIGLKNSFPMIGEEFIEIEFETPTLQKRKYKLYTHNIGDVEYADNNKTMMYVVESASKELITNVTKVVNTRLNQKISKSIETLITQDLKSSKKTMIDQTVGIDNHLISQLHPLQAIDKLRQRAVSAEFASSSFVFYEDHDGFHFTTLEKMIKAAKNPKIEWTYTDTYPTDVVNEDRFRQMITYIPVQTTNIIEKVQSGGTRNTVKHFDMITGEVRIVNYDDSKSPFDSSGKTPRDQTSSFSKEFGQTTGVSRLFTINDDQSDPLLAKTSNLPGFVNRINQSIINTVVHGDSSIVLGTPIKVIVSLALGTTEQENTTTNNYIVSKIRHTILTGHHPVYTQSVELIGNSYDTE